MIKIDKDTSYLIEVINKSNLSIIGYSFKDELILNKFLKINNIDTLNNIDYISDIKYELRNRKIDNILNDELVINKVYNNIIAIDISQYGFNINEKKIIFEEIRNFSVENDIKIIIKNPINRSLLNEETSINDFSNTPMLMLADFIFTFYDKKCEILKDRYSISPSNFVNIDDLL